MDLRVPLLVIALGALLAACTSAPTAPEEAADGEDVDTVPVEDSEAVPNVGLVDDILADPDAYLGEQVALSGTMTELVGPSAFRLAGSRVEGQGLLVISAGEPGVDARNEVAVRGVVREFDVPEAEEELGVDLADEVFDPLEGEPVVLASEVSSAAPLPNRQ